MTTILFILFFFYIKKHFGKTETIRAAKAKIPGSAKNAISKSKHGEQPKLQAELRRFEILLAEQAR